MTITNWKHGNTPLHLAAIRGFIDLTQLLVTSGAEVNAINRGKLTPLDEAIRYGYSDIIDLLLKHGAKESLTTSRQ